MHRLVTVVFSLSLLATSVAAQSESQCPKTSLADGDVIASPPGNTNPTVARNTLIRIDTAVLNPTLGLFRVVTSTDANGNEIEEDFPVPATWQRIGETNRFVMRPVDLLDAQTKHRITVRSDITKELTFMTSDVIDREPPTFRFGQDRVTAFSSVECGDEGARRVTITFDRARDDGDPGSIEYLLYLTRAADLEGPRLLARQYLASGAEDMTFTLVAEELATPVCVVVDAVDGVGRHAEGIDEFCFDPLQGSFFEPCSVGARLEAQHAEILGLLLAAFLGLRVRSRRLRAGANGRATLT